MDDIVVLVTSHKSRMTIKYNKENAKASTTQRQKAGFFIAFPCFYVLILKNYFNIFLKNILNHKTCN